jgi:hypothetical protein
MKICQLPFVGGVLSGAIATVLLAVARPTDWIFLASIRVEEIPADPGVDSRQAARQSEIAWNLCTAVFYKVGGRPWKVADIRDGVCYVGLVFKKDETTGSTRNACCAAQMFLDSGDGVVFKGALGPWYNDETGDFHLSYDAARKLGEMAVTSYTKRVGEPPKEMFIHGRVRFEETEWYGFRDAVGTRTNIVGIRIQEEKNLKLYRRVRIRY